MNIAIVCGGFSDEFPISIQSQKTVYDNLDPKKYNRYPIIIDRHEWYYQDEKGIKYHINKADFSLNLTEGKITFDCIFNVIHGTPGEDGKLQAYWDLLNIPYTSSDCLTSAVTFSKDVCKIQLRDCTKQAKSITVSKNEKFNIDRICEIVGMPCFVKPNSGGSSVGASKVNTKTELQPAIDKGFSVDNELIIEEFLEGQEITCGVTKFQGNIQSLAITLVKSEGAFFDYAAKYEDHATQEITPAPIDKVLYENCLIESEKIYKYLNCKGTIRVDYMIVGNELVFIEVNTIPGLSERSLIPQQTEYCNIKISDLFEDHIQEALASKNSTN
jgi:D-alanine-D-alanine ligase